ASLAHRQQAGPTVDRVDRPFDQTGVDELVRLAADRRGVELECGSEVGGPHRSDLLDPDEQPVGLLAQGNARRLGREVEAGHGPGGADEGSLQSGDVVAVGHGPTVGDLVAWCNQLLVPSNYSRLWASRSWLSSSSRLRSLPVGFRGSSATSSTSRGTLKRD